MNYFVTDSTISNIDNNMDTDMDTDMDTHGDIHMNDVNFNLGFGQGLTFGIETNFNQNTNVDYSIGYYPCLKLRNPDDDTSSNSGDNDNNNKNTDIVKFILSNDAPDVDYNSDSSDSDSQSDCCNPQCDHERWTDDEITNMEHVKSQPMIDIKSIDDLIKLGKTYHCKKNKIYYGIDLKILCKLVLPLTDLRNLVGMENIKTQIVDHIIFFLQKLNEKERCGSCINCSFGYRCNNRLNNDMLHTVITGPPGVGKTELGKILGNIYKAMGVLSKGHMNIATRSDLVGKYLGHTAAKTQAFINKCRGGVMFIDEAYALGNNEGRDSFSKECIDTLNQNLTERRDFLCIIAGYHDALERCFFNYNEGLRRRFPFRYNISGYSTDELAKNIMIVLESYLWY
jgi:hypothetical protein